MATTTHALPVHVQMPHQRPRPALPALVVSTVPLLRQVHSPGYVGVGEIKDAMEMAYLGLLKPIHIPEVQVRAVQSQSPESSTSSSSSLSSPSPGLSGLPTQDSNHVTGNIVADADFAPSKLDPIHIPRHNDFLRRPFTLKLKNASERERDFSHPVFASDVDSSLFRGFLRIFVADRPFYDPRGPPEWTAEYSAVYEICRRFYVQKFTDNGHSMLYRTKIRGTGEVAQLHAVAESVIGRPRPSVDMHRIVRIFEEAVPYAETEFSPLPPARPICERPTRVPHQPKCLCPRYWPVIPVLVEQPA